MLKNIKTLLIIFSFILCAILVSCKTDTDTPTPEPTVSPETSLTVEPTPSPSPSIGPTTQNNSSYTVEYTVATPAGGNIVGQATQVLKNGEASTEVEAVPASGYKFLYWSDGHKEQKRSGDVIEKDTTISAYFKMIVGDVTVPTIKIQTTDVDWINTKEYVNATITVEGSKDREHDGVFTTQIKGRGNSSWNGSADKSDYDSKNSYRLKLDEKQNFLGIGEAVNKDWVLNSCKFDVSLLRNWIGYKMGKLLSGIDHTTECTWAHVYLNGDYRGVYMVTDHLEVAEDRIDIDDGIEEADNGFLVELDMRGNSEGEEGVDYFYIDGYAVNESNPREWVIKSELSKDPEIAKQQLEFIKNYIQNVHNAIESGNREEIEKLVDIDSFVDMFICSEFSMDVDVNTASFFMYKDAGGKLCLTSPWDYDFGFGTYGVATNNYQLVSETSSANQWFEKLLHQKWFVTLVNERLKEIQTDVFHLMNETVAIGEKLNAAADKNDEKWSVYGEHYHKYVSYETSANLECYEEHVLYLNTWMSRRWENINGIIEMYIEELP